MRYKTSNDKILAPELSAHAVEVDNIPEIYSRSNFASGHCYSRYCLHERTTLYLLFFIVTAMIGMQAVMLFPNIV